MVSESQSITKEHLRKDLNDIYWEQRFTVKEDCIPQFLQPFKEKILLSGKYLNVIKECDVSIPDREAMIEFYESRMSKEMVLREMHKNQDLNA